MEPRLSTDEQENTGRFTPYGSFGRDEMNFAEFPIAALGKRNPGQKTLVFTDTIYGQDAKPTARTLTITASDAWGLPKSADDEVILGLIQLSAQNEFRSREQYFTRYELIKLLGWPDDGVSYKRIADSLKLWRSVTFHYDKAWWDNSEKSWVSETFGIIDSASIYDRERRERRLKTNPNNPQTGLSSIEWSKVVFKSFQEGNVKNLNFQFYRELETPLSKRLFRFLDKRLHKKQALLEIDIEKLACDHVGLSRNYIIPEIKRKLFPAITELEQKGFLAPLPISKRFKQIGRGKWEVAFSRLVLKEKTSKKREVESSAVADSTSKPRGRQPRKSGSEAVKQQSLPYPVQPSIPESVRGKRNYEEPSPERRAAEKKLVDELFARMGWKRDSDEREAEQLDLL